VDEIKGILARAAGIPKFDLMVDIQAHELLANLSKQFLKRSSKPAEAESGSDSDE
jgi:hypothetical protein